MPSELQYEWLTFRNELKQLEEIKIPRWLGMRPQAESHIYGFCDASTKAYAAVIYLCTKRNDGQPISQIVASKTRVAPLHSITIPRLELSAAHLLATLLGEIKGALRLEQISYRLFPDSNIVLHWLHKSTSQLNQYVANRVGFIQQKTDIANWHHIPTKLNPADCASRGSTVSALLHHHLWWHGPTSDNYPIARIHTLAPEEIVEMEGELKPVKSNVMQTTTLHTLQTRRHKHIMMNQRMASLPKARVTPAPPFSVSGVDYCGPFNIRIGSKAIRTVKKTYAAIFVCMATKAVHIELAEDLSAEAFINIYTRFVNRRGLCTDLYSDNGTAFVGANRMMAEDLQAWHGEYAQQNLANKGTRWHFISPGAPHHGGLWEAAVKSAKKHILRIVDTRSIYYDQLHTLLVHVEPCLNSRPLVALHDTLDDKMALSPADFLIGRSIVAVAEKSTGEVPSNRLSYYRQLRQMQQHFWQQWHDEYLSTLQTRSKWHKNNDSIQLGDIVIIRHENLPATHWRLGRVVRLHPGTDGLVRVVTIKHATGECMRPIQKICRLLDHPELTRPAGQDV
ncbi:PREDICTED: uncharacterized protein LOC108363795 [Rhagoletis zephyria]|uniref:uncharacterized protein LOC108363795 n=1 Tax=Rhagoletis zephyria TaxID=28612 RepID=UPI0008114594|nr:PREDICTED: uncharacterized protein LOC108363795 [Rhagoletis zephyria]